MLGVGIMVYVFQLGQKTRLPLVRSLLHLIIFVQLMALIALNYDYLRINLLGGRPGEMDNISISILLVFVLLAQAGIVVKLMQVSEVLISSRATKMHRHIIFGWIAVFSVGHVAGIMYFDDLAVNMTLYYWHAFWLLFMFALIFYNIFWLWNVSNGPKLAEVKIFTRPFCQFLGLAFFLVFLDQLNFYFFRFDFDILDPLSQLSINIAFVIWIKYYLPEYISLQIKDQSNEAIAVLSLRFDISAREREIISAVLLGKTNKQISEELFISPHTVKNHLYNIFQKLDVNSRTQLQHLLITLNE